MAGSIVNHEEISERAEFWVGLAVEIGQGSQESADVTVARARALCLATDMWVSEVFKEHQKLEGAFRSVAINELKEATP